MQAFVKIVLKLALSEIVCVSNADGNDMYYTVSELRKLYKAKQISLENAIITSNNVVRHKHGTRMFIVTNSEIDLNKCINNKIYDGTTDKFGITLNGVDFIVKLAKSAMDTSCYSEYVATRFMSSVGLDTHKVKLVVYKTEPCVLLCDFAVNGYKLHTYKDTEQSSEDTDIQSKLYTYADIVDMLKKHTKVPEEKKNNVLQQFWTMFLCDAILANRDRHRGNWGYLSKDGIYAMAPIYDNGACLFPDVKRNLSEFEVDPKTFLINRSEQFPVSLMGVYDCELQRVKRTNYYEYVEMCKDATFLQCLEKFRMLGVDLVIIKARNAVNNWRIPALLQKFYVCIIAMRYLHIIQRETLEDSYNILEQKGLI